jgi:AAA15 family ATPase/GTPase
MENWLKNVRIQNFKSLRDVSLKCERINLFVGKPNVGKSNFLEALSLLGPNYLDNQQGFGRPMLRYEQAANLFFDQGFLEDEIMVSANKIISSTLKFEQDGFQYEMAIKAKGSVSARFSSEGKIHGFEVSKDKIFFPVKHFIFPENQRFTSNSNTLYLVPPYGENFLNVLQSHKNLRKEASSLFEPYGLELLVDSPLSRLEIVKRQDGILFKTPYALVADTLRRYLFHLSAIESNRDSVLLFEEPESHNFPPFIQRLAHRMMEDESNQYFITTHSPFLFNTLVEKSKDVAVFVVEYEDFQTKVRRLSEENLREILDYGLNIFTEQELFA